MYHYVADYELSCLQLIQLLTSGRYVSRDFKITLTKKCRKKSKPSASNVCVNLKNGTIIEMLFLNVNMTVEALFLLYLQEKFGAFFTSAEREVKNSRRSGMYQSSLFLTRLSTQSL